MKKLFLIMLLPLAIVLALIVKFNLDNILPFINKCPHYELFHIYCPGCGNTRAVRALLGGDIFLSLRCNPAIVSIIICLFIYYIEVITDKKILPRKPLFWTAIGILFVIYYTLRNFIPLLYIPEF